MDKIYLEARAAMENGTATDKQKAIVILYCEDVREAEQLFFEMKQEQKKKGGAAK